MYSEKNNNLSKWMKLPSFWTRKLRILTIKFNKIPVKSQFKFWDRILPNDSKLISLLEWVTRWALGSS